MRTRLLAGGFFLLTLTPLAMADDLADDQRAALGPIRESLTSFLGDAAPERSWSDERIAARPGGVAGWIRQTEPVVRRRLGQLYAEVRQLVISAEDVSLRERRLKAWQALTTPRREMIELIQRYEKPEQPEVDRRRRELEILYERYVIVATSDERRLALLPTERARALADTMTAGETLLGSMRSYLERFDPPGFDIWPPRTLSGDLAARKRVLPGREETDLEEVLWSLLQLRAGRLGNVMERIGEILRSGDELSTWEQMLLLDALFRALDRYNVERVAEDLTHQELICTEVTNTYRAVLGLRPLIIEPRLVRASRRHSQEMTDLGYFGHQSPVKLNEWPADRTRQEGYQGGAAENCFSGGSSGQGAFEAWYHSPGHHRNMIGGHLQMGVGHDRGGSMWTELFGAADGGWRVLHEDLEGAEAELAQHLVDAARTRTKLPKVLSPATLHPLARAASQGSARRDPRLVPHAGALSEALTRTALEVTAAEPWVKFGLELLLRNLDHSDERVRGESLLALRRLTSKSFELDPKASAADRRESVRHWNDWWERVHTKFRIDPVALAALESAQLEADSSLEIGVALKDVRGPDVRVETPRTPVPVMTEKQRMQIVKANGGGEDTERAIERALDWLAAHQHPDGAWRGKRFVDLQTGADGAGQADHEIGITGLALLSFLSRHHLPDDPQYGEAISKGLHFLKTRVQDFGKFKTGASHYMYSHALGTQALAKAYGLTGDPDLKLAAQRAVDFIIYAQHPSGGGWRYDARQWPDTSVTGWQVLALHDAWKAKLRVAGFQGARRWIDLVSQRGYFRVGYMSKTDVHASRPRLTSVGMLAKLACGSRATDGPLRSGGFWLLKSKPDRAAPDYYYWYYASYALFQMGDEFFPDWNKSMKRALLALQCKDRNANYGSFNPNTEWGGYGGRIYSTALAILTLEVYYRYQRFPEVRDFPLTGSWSQTFKTDYLSRMGKGARSNVDREVAKREIEEHFGSGAISFVCQALETTDELELRKDLSEILRMIGTPSAVPRVIRLLDDPDPTVKSHLFECLGRVGDEAVVEFLRQQLTHADPHHRAYSARELGRCGDVASLPKLRERMANKPGKWEKDQFQGAMNRLWHLEAVEELIGDLNNLKEQDREDLRAGLDVFTDRPLLLQALIGLEDVNKRLYVSCAKVLTLFGRSAPVPICIELMMHTDENIRAHAVDFARRLSGVGLPFDPKGEPKDRMEQIVEWRLWWNRNRRDFNPDVK